MLRRPATADALIQPGTSIGVGGDHRQRAGPVQTRPADCDAVVPEEVGVDANTTGARIGLVEVTQRAANRELEDVVEITLVDFVRLILCTVGAATLVPGQYLDTPEFVL